MKTVIFTSFMFLVTSSIGHAQIHNEFDYYSKQWQRKDCKSVALTVLRMAAVKNDFGATPLSNIIESQLKLINPKEALPKFDTSYRDVSQQVLTQITATSSEALHDKDDSNSYTIQVRKQNLTFPDAEGSKNTKRHDLSMTYSFAVEKKGNLSLCTLTSIDAQTYSLQVEPRTIAYTPTLCQQDSKNPSALSAIANLLSALQNKNSGNPVQQFQTERRKSDLCKEIKSHLGNSVYGESNFPTNYYNAQEAKQYFSGALNANENKNSGQETFTHDRPPKGPSKKTKQ
ncbi:MAG: hypothetical protein AB7F59_10475 [Bdellovibrionales bacterium]